jgi:triacylglycerol esterase/lipase EstA (alpha/beta hydrolase family)
MRAIFGVMSLLIVLVVVGMLAKKQLVAMSATQSHLQSPALAEQPANLPSTSAGATQQVRSQQIQQQIKQSVEAAMQQARPMPDDEK